MAQFFKNILSSILGTFIALGILTFFLIATIAGLSSYFDESTTDIDLVENSNYIKFNFNSPIVECEIPSPLQKLKFARKYFPAKTSLHHLIQSLEKIAEDKKIAGIYLNLSEYKGGLAQTQEVESAIQKVKKAGKKVIVYSNGYNEKSYQLASLGDYIGINPSGQLEFNGIAAEIMYFTGLFEKLGIDIQIFKCGKYKSAVEPFFRKDMSKENRRQLHSFLSDIQNGIYDSVSIRRKINIDKVNSISNNLEIRSAQDADHLNFVSHVDYEKNFLRSVKPELGIDNFKFASYTNYLSAKSSEREFEEDKVAILHAEGEIIDGFSKDPDYIGEKTIVEQLEKLTKDSSVKGIILRINSPGGSAMASDIMWGQIQETKRFKPIVASMSDYAASGGYYMAMGCDYIVAQPQTITGSIGVFGLYPSFGKFYEGKLGITYDTVSTGKYANIFSTTKTMTVQESEIIQTGVNNIYETFLFKASLGREMDQAEIEEIASGRVWTGNQASTIGLVDELGGVPQAKLFLDSKLGTTLPLYTYGEIEGQNLEDELIDISPQVVKIPQSISANPLFQEMNRLQKLENQTGVQARIPFKLEIE